MHTIANIALFHPLKMIKQLFILFYFILNTFFSNKTAFLAIEMIIICNKKPLIIAHPARHHTLNSFHI